MIDQEQVDGWSMLKSRSGRGAEVLGILKAGVTPTQATANLNSVGAYLSKAYPKDDDRIRFKLARPGLAGDMLGGPVRAFLAGLMTLAALILLAACANLGSLFAARAADRSREIALRLALGSSRRRILRQLLTEALLVSLAGGATGVLGSVLLLALAERMAASTGFSHPLAGKSRCACVRRGVAVGGDERNSVRRGAGATGDAHESV